MTEEPTAKTDDVQVDVEVNERMRKFESEFRVRSNKKQTFWTVTQRMQHHRVPGLSIAVIRDGKLAWAKAFGVKQAGNDDLIDPATVFSVGSLSKVATAAATLRLADRGLVDLDEDVNNYMQEWKIPDSKHTKDGFVSLRRIMSHTSGLTVHGFRDFQPDDELPSTLDILNGRRPARNRAVRVAVAPGTKFQYSGGGVMVEQQVIEEVLSCDFATAANELVFTPLQMTRSTFANPLPASHQNIAKAHNRRGEPRALPRGWESMPECAAAGLWTTPSDYARLLIALIESYRGSAEEPFLVNALAQAMMTEVEPGRFGLGPALHGTGPTRCFEHGGSNDSYKAYFRANLSSGNGLVICTNGARGKALITEAHTAIAGVEGWPEMPDADDFWKLVPLANKFLEMMEQARQPVP